MLVGVLYDGSDMRLKSYFIHTSIKRKNSVEEIKKQIVEAGGHVIGVVNQ